MLAWCRRSKREKGALPFSFLACLPPTQESLLINSLVLRLGLAFWLITPVHIKEFMRSTLGSKLKVLGHWSPFIAFSVLSGFVGMLPFSFGTYDLHPHLVLLPLSYLCSIEIPSTVQKLRMEVPFSSLKL